MTKKKRKEKRDSALNALIFLNSLFSGECNKYEKKNNYKKRKTIAQIIPTLYLVKQVIYLHVLYKSGTSW